MEDCIFCKIVAGRVPAAVLYQDSDVIAFRDINPKAPVHVLVIPKKHIDSVAALSEADLPLVGKMTAAARKVAEQEGIAKSGYRLTINTGPDSGMIVHHLHMHLMGGKRLADHLC